MRTVVVTDHLATPIVRRMVVSGYGFEVKKSVEEGRKRERDHTNIVEWGNDRQAKVTPST